MKTRDVYDRYRGFRDGIRNITDPSPNHRSYHTGHDEGKKVRESFTDLIRRTVAEAIAKRERGDEGGSPHLRGVARYTQGLSDALRGREAQEVSTSSKPYYDDGYQAGREIAARLVGESTGEVIALVGAAAAEGLARSEEFISQLKLRAGVWDGIDSRVQGPPSIPEPDFHFEEPIIRERTLREKLRHVAEELRNINHNALGPEKAAAEVWSYALALETIAEQAPADPRLQVARVVAEYWRDEAMKGIEKGENSFAMMSHPCALIVGALDGETNPVELGIPEDEFKRRMRALGEAPEPGRGEDFTTHQRDLDYFARLWTAGRMIRDEVRSHVRKGEGTVSTTPAVAALMEAMVLPPDIEAALVHRSVLGEPGPEHLSEEARRGLAETVYERSRRGPREDDLTRSVTEEPQSRVWILAFAKGTATTTVRIDDREGMTATDAVKAAREEYGNLADYRFVSGESPDHEQFPAHRWLRSDGWRVGVSKEDKDHTGPTRRYLVPLEGDSPPDYGAVLIESPKDPEFTFPLPEDTPGDTARLAEEAAVNPDVDDHPRLCPVHGVRDQDGYGGPQHRCNSIVRKEEGIPILCGEPTSIVQEGD